MGQRWYLKRGTGRWGVARAEGKLGGYLGEEGLLKLCPKDAQSSVMRTLHSPCACRLAQLSQPLILSIRALISSLKRLHLSVVTTI